METDLIIGGVLAASAAVNYYLVREEDKSKTPPDGGQAQPTEDKSKSPPQDIQEDSKSDS